MYTQPNRLLTPTSRIIKPYNCCFIATEGPNIIGKLDLSGLEIQYESEYNSRVILEPNSKNVPLRFGYLGDEITFLMLKITYDETNPYCMVEEDKYIEYYYSTDTNNIMYAGKFIVLTGNSTHKIPQIYLNNPSETMSVVIDILAGNYGDVTTTTDSIVIKALYHNDIVSNSLFNSLTMVSGSTQFEIMTDNQVALRIEYNEISILTIDEDSNSIYIVNTNGKKMTLEFLSTFEMYQAYSRMKYVMLDKNNRILTTSIPSIDISAPDITMTSGLTMINNEYTINIPSGTTVNGEYLINYFISSITDNRDNINKYDSDIIIRKFNESSILSNIVVSDKYDITISSKDNANNKSFINVVVNINI